MNSKLIMTYYYKKNDKYDDGSKYSIFGITDKSDFSLFGGNDLTQIALKSLSNQRTNLKQYNLGKVEGMKEGYMSEDLLLFEKDPFNPQNEVKPFQAKNISDIYKTNTFKTELKKQAEDKISKQLKEKENILSELNYEMGTFKKYNIHLQDNLKDETLKDELKNKKEKELKSFAYELFNKEYEAQHKYLKGNSVELQKDFNKIDKKLEKWKTIKISDISDSSIIVNKYLPLQNKPIVLTDNFTFLNRPVLNELRDKNADIVKEIINYRNDKQDDLIMTNDNFNYKEFMAPPSFLNIQTPNTTLTHIPKLIETPKVVEIPPTPQTPQTPTKTQQNQTETIKQPDFNIIETPKTPEKFIKGHGKEYYNIMKEKYDELLKSKLLNKDDKKEIDEDLKILHENILINKNKKFDPKKLSDPIYKQYIDKGGEIEYLEGGKEKTFKIKGLTYYRNLINDRKDLTDLDISKLNNNEKALIDKQLRDKEKELIYSSDLYKDSPNYKDKYDEIVEKIKKVQAKITNMENDPDKYNMSLKKKLMIKSNRDMVKNNMKLTDLSQKVLSNFYKHIDEIPENKENILKNNYLKSINKNEEDLTDKERVKLDNTIGKKIDEIYEEHNKIKNDMYNHKYILTQDDLNFIYDKLDDESFNFIKNRLIDDKSLNEIKNRLNKNKK